VSIKAAIENSLPAIHSLLSNQTIVFNTCGVMAIIANAAAACYC